MEIPVKGHHLSRIGAFIDIDKASYRELMVRRGYSEHQNDSFTTETYDFFQRLGRDPAQRILVIAGGSDLICQECPESKKAQCFHHNPEANPLRKNVFWNNRITPERIDTDSAKKAGLEIGKTYSVEEIINATRAQTEEFKASLEG